MKPLTFLRSLGASQPSVVKPRLDRARRRAVLILEDQHHRGQVMRKMETASLPHLVRMAAQFGLRHLRTSGETAWASA